MVEWATIESDPGVFSDMINKLGCKSLQMEEIIDLDDETYLNGLEKIHGFIFLFKFDKNYKMSSLDVIPPETLPEVMFLKQTVTNACGTQAIMSLLLNMDDCEKAGDFIVAFKEEIRGLNPYDRGMSIGHNNHIASVHNSFGSPDLLFIPEVKDSLSEHEKTYHFISFLPVEGKVYELDGLRDGPICIGDTSSDWKMVVIREIQRKLRVFPEGEIEFNLLALIDNINDKTSSQIEEINTQLVGLSDAISATTDENEKRRLSQQMDDCNAKLLILNETIERENRKFMEYSLENERRQHSYVPFIVELLKVIGEENMLYDLYDNIKDVKTKAIQAKK